jgi:hypothetical protein
MVSASWVGGHDVQLRDKAAVDYLNSANTVRDGRLVGLRLASAEDEWDVVLHLSFDVPMGLDGDSYELVLRDELVFEYSFSNEIMLDQIEHMKCLWTDDGAFYLSLDPYDEREQYPTDQDNECFRAKSALLTVTRQAV